MSFKKNLEEINTTSLLIDQTISKPKDKNARWRGVFYGLLAPLSFALCNSLMRKCNVLNFSEIAMIRFFLQLIVVLPINIKYKRNVFGEKDQRIKLSVRSIFNVCSIMFFYFSIQLINPSESTALFNCCIIFVTLFARIFLKERLTFVHVLVLLMTTIGIFLISQPDFLFTKLTSNNNSLLFNSTKTRQSYINNLSSDYIKLSGVILALLASFSYTIVALITKKLANMNAHISVICAFFSYFGLPTTIFISTILVVTGVEKRPRLSFDDDYKLAWDIFFATISAIFGFGGQVLMNMAMQIEDANVVSIFDCFGLIYNFLFQYLLLNIVSNYLSALGAMLIFLGAIFVMCYRILDKQHEKRSKKLKMIKNSENSKKSTGILDILKKLLFYKF